jgi:hypothetical protein
MAANVRVFSAGEHMHADPEEAGELVALLLNRSGYTKDFEWECRIDKMKHCDSASRPIRVIGHKPYGIILRVKPHPHATTDQQMTLMIPSGSGYSASNLVNQLKNNEKSISRMWRQQEKKVNMTTTTEFQPKLNGEPKPEQKTSIQVPISIVPPPIELQFSNLKGVQKDNSKLKYILEAISRIEKAGFFNTREHFNDMFRHECKLETHPLKSISRCLCELTKSGYLQEVVNDRDKLIGFHLANKGFALLKNEKIIEEKRIVVPKVNPTSAMMMATLMNLGEKIQEAANVAKKLAENENEKQRLKNEIERIDNENEELLKVVRQDRESHEVLLKLQEVISPLPIK